MNRFLPKLFIKPTTIAPKNLQIIQQCFSTKEPQTTPDEQTIRDILSKRFPNAKTIEVQDTSGGCGAMFNVYIESSEFKGMSLLKQHKTVYEALEKQIKEVHGLHLITRPA